MSHETPRKTALALLRLTMILLLASVGTMILEIFVRQTPYSPYQIALPIDPFEQLRGTALVLALVGFCLHSLVERGLFGAKEPWALVGLFGTGAVGTVVTLAVAASLGMNAVQIIDPRPGSSLIFAVRAVFALCLLSAFALVMRPVFRRSPKP